MSGLISGVIIGMLVAVLWGSTSGDFGYTEDYITGADVCAKNDGVKYWESRRLSYTFHCNDGAEFVLVKKND